LKAGKIFPPFFMAHPFIVIPFVRLFALSKLQQGLKFRTPKKCRRLFYKKKIDLGGGIK